MSNDVQKHWLYRPENRIKIWGFQILLLLLALLPEFFIHRHAYFESLGITIDASWGFFAWYGFVTCLAMVVAAKVIGIFLKRGENYYDE